MGVWVWVWVGQRGAADSDRGSEDGGWAGASDGKTCRRSWLLQEATTNNDLEADPCLLIGGVRL